jgi:hypothetical protein
MLLYHRRNGMKCQGMHLDRRLKWTKHIKVKRNQLKVKVKNTFATRKVSRRDPLR